MLESNAKQSPAILKTNQNRLIQINLLLFDIFFLLFVKAKITICKKFNFITIFHYFSLFLYLCAFITLGNIFVAKLTQKLEIYDVRRFVQPYLRYPPKKINQISPGREMTHPKKIFLQKLRNYSSY